MFKSRKTWLLLLLIPLALFAGPCRSRKPSESERLLNQLYASIERGEVQRIEVESSDDDARQYLVHLKGGQERTYYVMKESAEQVVERAVAKAVPVTYKRSQLAKVLHALVDLLPAIIIFGFLYQSVRKVKQAAQEVEASTKGDPLPERVDPSAESNEKVTFEDVAGIDAAEGEIQEVVNYLKEPKRWERLGAKCPKGVLLYGPPGSGKTMLARAMANEAGVAFFPISAAEFFNQYVGESARRVREFFAKAREAGQAIIFIDEIDTIAQARGDGHDIEHSSYIQPLNQLLTEMDGFHGGEGVIVIAATNRLEALDKAIIRPGRFDRIIHIQLPDVRGREEILRATAKRRQVPLAADVDLRVLARSTPGFSGAELVNLMNEAAYEAGRNDRAEVTQADFDAARDRILLGSKSARVMSPEELNVVAVHEAATRSCRTTSVARIRSTRSRSSRAAMPSAWLPGSRNRIASSTRAKVWSR